MTMALPAVAAGSLRHLVVIQKHAPGRDSFGAPIETWQDVLTARASISLLRQSEQFQGGFAGQVTHTVVLRWPGNGFAIAPGMRVVHGAHRYRVQTVDNVEQRNRWLTLMVLEINEAE